MEQEMWKRENEEILERYELSMERVRAMRSETSVAAPFYDYFQKTAEFIGQIEILAERIGTGCLAEASLEELQELNRKLYEDVAGAAYAESYACPETAVRQLGEGYGQLLSFLCTEIRGMIVWAYERRLTDLTVVTELFIEIYNAFEEGVPELSVLKEIVYWYISDYCDVWIPDRVREQLDPELSFARDIICKADLSDVRYLYAFGEYITENELEMSRFLSKLPEEEIEAMASTFTEGYRMGFVNAGIDLSRKKTVNIRYSLGFERMVRAAIEQFAKMGLESIIYREARHSINRRAQGNPGYGSTSFSKQYFFDHREDSALYLDSRLVERRLSVLKAAYEEYKEQAAGYGGPAVVETFGEADFSPIVKDEALRLSREQSRLWVEYRSRMGELQREYIPEEERSFTIIAFPVPEIGPVFQELFRETIRINTLDYMLYRRVQQTLIDVLDKADYCEIRGMDGNRTRLKINLYKLADPEKETIFENCVADVNIPVGEVFTSPVLKGTEGVLHVKRVFLNGLEYKNLEISFQDGMISGYSCDNYDKDFLYENILFRHDTLPMGEFAIGTNTTAYVAARRLGVEAKLPILIAEKMGPHFAVGDTCYSHVEEIRVYNPDGKEIVAKANEISDLRRENQAKAYFNCHTDITIPYDELGELAAVGKEESRYVIINEGRFVLPGCEELNKAFEEG